MAVLVDFGAKFIELGIFFSTMAVNFVTGLGEINTSLGGLNTVWGLAFGVGGGIKTKVEEAFNSIINDVVVPKMNDIYRFMITDGINKIKDNWSTKIGEIVTILDTTLTNSMNLFKTTVLDPFAKGWQILREKMENVVTWIGNVVRAIATFDFGALAKLFGLKLPNAGGTAADPIHDAYGGSIPGGAPRIVGEHGWELMAPVGTGKVFNQTQLAGMMRAAQARVGYQPVMTKPVIHHSLTVNYGGVSISNGMDMAAFDNHVRKVIRQEFIR